jgi:hypothetical protein
MPTSGAKSLDDTQSLDRWVNRWGNQYLQPGRVLKPGLDHNGYLQLMLSKDGRKTHKFVHRLVLDAFDRPRPAGMECCHGKGGKQDNRWLPGDPDYGICWGTREENNRWDKVRDGTLLRGEDHPNAVMTEQEVLEMHRLYNSERDMPRSAGRGHSSGRRWTHRALGERFGIDQRAVSDIISGKNWSYLMEDETNV